jgi:hypothetical protein
VQQARELLASVYSWLTERFDTRDLKEAKALLEECTPNSFSKRPLRFGAVQRMIDDFRDPLPGCRTNHCRRRPAPQHRRDDDTSTKKMGSSPNVLILPTRGPKLVKSNLRTRTILMHGVAPQICRSGSPSIVRRRSRKSLPQASSKADWHFTPPR